MDDLGQKLAGLLNDPDTMSKVRQMAENILGDDQKSTPSNADPFSGLLGAEELQSLISVISRLKSAGDDPRSRLLNALKPHLSEPRREKVDTAIKILKIIELLPLMKDSGLLNF